MTLLSRFAGRFSATEDTSGSLVGASSSAAAEIVAAVEPSSGQLVQRYTQRADGVVRYAWTATLTADGGELSLELADSAGFDSRGPMPGRRCGDALVFEHADQRGATRVTWALRATGELEIEFAASPDGERFVVTHRNTYARDPA